MNYSIAMSKKPWYVMGKATRAYDKITKNIVAYDYYSSSILRTLCLHNNVGKMV